MKEVVLAKGMKAIVDDEDYESVACMKWRAVKHRKTFYAVSSPYMNGRQTTVRMHRVILAAGKSALVDHKNGNGLDNRRENLRMATSVQNAQNRRFTAGVYKGVHRRSDRHSGKVWIARIQISGKSKLIGCFLTPEEAARAYDIEARASFGAFATTNF